MICNLHLITTIDIMMHTLLHMRSMPHHLTVLFLIHASILSLVPNPHVSAQSTDGFVSIDCGSPDTKSYTDALGITWTPDSISLPEIDGFSKTSQGIPLTTSLSKSQRAYESMRYFQSGNAMNANKFCYSLQATGGSYYLVRATFWSGGTRLPYDTRKTNAVSFQIIVDTYEGQEIEISLPQSDVWIEEMYVRAQASFVMVCLSAASDTSDVPFINSLELRPLRDETLGVVDMVKSTNSALRLVDRQNFGEQTTSAAVVRYPQDIYDRLWYRSSLTPESSLFQITPDSVDVSNSTGRPPMSVVQSIVVAKNIAYTISPSSIISPLTRTTTTGQHNYSVMLYFFEFNKAVVNRSGQRVFNLTLSIGNSALINQETLDIFSLVGVDKLWEVSTGKTPVGPYGGDIKIEIVTLPTSQLSASIAAAEVLQLFSNSMLTPTASLDGVAIRDISALRNFSSVIGDPCLPLAYKYPWLNCTSNEQPPRVTSLFLSNYGLSGAIPSSINNLDRISEIYLDQNALAGALPDLSNLANLRTLNLSYNKLSGGIPNSLGRLPKLTYLDLRYNELSGEIPPLLKQKVDNGQLTFRYEGNNLVSSGGKKRSHNLPLIIGVVVGGVVFLFIAISVIIMCRNNFINFINRWCGPIPPRPRIRHFEFQEIRRATNNFSEERVIGRGGFGIVYEGILEDNQVVAIKVSSGASRQSSRQFLTEVDILSRVHHHNLVQLVGYCTRQRLVLVYEFMPNGSLFDRLFRSTSLAPTSTPLTWIQRLRILLHAAQGLAYLHNHCNPRIIHMDIKSSNILITGNLEGKVSDFGISTPNSVDGGIPMPRTLAGTPGYMDPELMHTSILSETADIYSFGIVLFEALCGRPALDQRDANRRTHILDWAGPYLDRGEITNIVDEEIGNYRESSVFKVADIAMECVRYRGRTQPTMNQVCNDLEQALGLETTGSPISPTTTREVHLFDDVRAR